MLRTSFSRAVTEGRLREAEEMLRRHRAVEGPGLDAAHSLRMAGRLLIAQGDPAGAADALEASVKACDGVGRSDQLADGWLTDLGAAQTAADRAPAAKLTLERAVELSTRLRGHNDWGTVRALRLLAGANRAAGDLPGAITALASAAAGAQAATPPDTGIAAMVTAEWAAALRAAGRDDEARRVAGPAPSATTAGAPAAETPPPPDDPAARAEILEKALAELDHMVGLAGVKAQVKTLTDLLAVQARRKQAGRRTPDMAMHLVFSGPPGTGKTTVARLMGRIYHGLGLLTSGHLIEVDRAGLVAGFVGQTATKVDEAVQRALDGVLFVDEAYALAQGGENDFGKEALSALLKRIEDNRDRLSVILAGYTDEMAHLLSTNPGLASRFPTQLTFASYTPTELAQIFRGMAGTFDYRLSAAADARLLEICTRWHAEAGPAFGNARAMRNLFEDAIAAAASRVVDTPAANFSLLEPADLDVAALAT